MILTFYNSVYYVSSYVIEYITPHITKATRFCPRRFSLFCIFTFIFFHELHFFISTVSSGCCSRSDLHPAPAAPDCYGSHDHHAYVQSYDPQEPSCQHIRGIVHAQVYCGSVGISSIGTASSTVSALAFLLSFTYLRHTGRSVCRRRTCWLWSDRWGMTCPLL